MDAPVTKYLPAKDYPDVLRSNILDLKMHMRFKNVCSVLRLRRRMELEMRHCFDHYEMQLSKCHRDPLVSEEVVDS